MKKVLYTLNIGGYAPEITALTYPLLKNYAKKIGADFWVIADRKFPEWPVVYEKLQIYELGRDNDWNIYIDSDALVHPDMFDVTNHLTPDTVCHNAHDMAGNRWKYDRFFWRDARHISSCNWFAVASGWCIDLWRPNDDLTPAEAQANIFPAIQEVVSEEFDASHLIDDYTLSRNIAKFGLKLKTVMSIMDSCGMKTDTGGRYSYMWHAYNIPRAEKVRQMRDVIRKWGIEGLMGQMRGRSAEATA